MRNLKVKQTYSKIKAYIGFAKKSRNIIFGSDDIIKNIKKAKLVLVSSLLGSSSFEKLKNEAKKQKIKIIVLNSDDYNELFDSEFIKATAITDANLSDAIKIILD